MGKGDRILVHSENCDEMFWSMFAAFRIGAVWVPTNFRLLPDEVTGSPPLPAPGLFLPWRLSVPRCGGESGQLRTRVHLVVRRRRRFRREEVAEAIAEKADEKGEDAAVDDNDPAGSSSHRAPRAARRRRY